MRSRITCLWLPFVVILGSVVSPMAAQGGATKPKRYNIVFLFADDQRPDTIGAWGNEHIQTPNLNKLVKAGVSFRNAYCMGSMGGAVCVPSRAMVMSGRTLFRINNQLRGILTLGEYLQGKGYLTFGTGKWHNGADSFLRSFDLGPAVMLGGMSNHFEVPTSRMTKDRKMERFDSKGQHSSEIYADAAVDFLKNHAAKKKHKDKPFFLYVAFQAPHDPRDAPKKYRQMYYKKRPPLPKNFMPKHPFNNGQLRGRDEDLAGWPRTKKVVGDQLAEYYALITHMDTQIGRIIQALKDSGEFENTIIVFAADHGLAVGSHGLLGKQNVYDHSMGTPMIFAGPGIPKNEQRDALVYLFDIFPTLCEYNGLKVPSSVEGKSLLPVIRGKSKNVRDSVYLNYRFEQRAVRDHRWKLTVYPKINHLQLFDLKNDPDELKNLANNPKQAKRVARMKKMILKWEAKLGKKGIPLTSKNPAPKVTDFTKRARKPDRWQPAWIRMKYFPKPEMSFLLRRRVPYQKDNTIKYKTVRSQVRWKSRETAIIVCDMWDSHHCPNAVKRVVEMAPRMNKVLETARNKGVFIIHAPSSCMEAYKNHPARKRAQKAPQAKKLPKDIGRWCHNIPSESKVPYPIEQSDGLTDCDCDEATQLAWNKKLREQRRNVRTPWKAQIDILKIRNQDAISDSGVEIWNLLESRGIDNVILVGVHTNMCVLGRPFGLRQMAKNGKNVVLMRDMTDTMYNPKRRPYVSHFRGTELIIEYIEKVVCPTVTSNQIIGGTPFRFEGQQ
ncbi:MAG: sulfatase-like hydrolase/transferase [Gemmataceae bacterium]